MVQVWTTDPSSCEDPSLVEADEILVGNIKNLLGWTGRFRVEDIRGMFTTRKEAEKFAKTQKVR